MLKIEEHTPELFNDIKLYLRQEKAFKLFMAGDELRDDYVLQRYEESLNILRNNITKMDANSYLHTTALINFQIDTVSDMRKLDSILTNNNRPISDIINGLENTGDLKTEPFRERLAEYKSNLLEMEKAGMSHCSHNDYQKDAAICKALHTFSEAISEAKLNPDHMAAKSTLDNVSKSFEDLKSSYNAYQTTHNNASLPRAESFINRTAQSLQLSMTRNLQAITLAEQNQTLKHDDGDKTFITSNKN